MKIGWLDYNKNDRALFFESIYNMEKGTNDELGLGSIRDMFSDIFFPGISTIQTRAKYFILLPQILSELENKNRLTPNNLYKREAKLCKCISENTKKRGLSTKGIIGIDSLDDIQNINKEEKELKWVQRTPSEVYWSGLVTLGIVKNVKHLSEYINLINIKNNNNITGSKFDDDADDRINDTTINYPKIDITIPKIDEDNINITLTEEEKEILSEVIINSSNKQVSTSLFSYLVNKHVDTLPLDFGELNDVLNDYNEEYKRYYDLAVKFRKFSKNLRVFYYGLLTKNDSYFVNNDFNKEDITLEELEEIFNIPTKLTQFKPLSSTLKEFLKESLRYFIEEDEEKLKDLIIKREKRIKQGNTKINDGKKYELPSISGLLLDYRYDTARQIILDIVDKEDYYDKSYEE